MNFSQKLGIFILVVIACVYVYFSFFAKNGFSLPAISPLEHEALPPVLDEFTPTEETSIEETPVKSSSEVNVKIFIYDSNGKLRSVNRKCDTSIQKSCFAYAINELVSAPTKWEKSKGFTSEIPSGTKVISVREGNSNVMIDLNSTFESGGGTESTYRRIKQIIKTANANTKLPTYLYINGKQADVIGGDGIMIKQPLNERSLDE